MRKKILFIMCFSFLSLLPLVNSQCLTPTGDLIEINDSNTEIVLCTGTYYLGDPGWSGVYIEYADNVVFDCNGSTLINPLDGEIIGIFSDSCNNLTIKNCILRNYGWQILPSHCNNVTIHDNIILNTVNNYGEASGILCDCTDNIWIYNNIIENITSTSSGEIDLQGIWIDTCEGAVIENNEISGSQERGLRIEKIMGTQTRGNYIHDNRLGVYMIGTGTTNWVTLDSQDDIITDNENDFHLMELANVTVLNTTYDTVVFNATGITGTSGENSCGQQTEPGAVCYVERQWYLDANVQDQSVSPLENVNFIIKDVFDTELFNGLTISDGTIPRQIITQYVQNFTGNTSYTPHTVSLSKTGYVASDEIVTVNTNKFLTLTLESEVVDTDGDGLTDDEEAAGWNITQYSCAGALIQVVHVTSDPNTADQDADGLNDYEEREGWHVSYVWNSIPIEYDVSSHPSYADVDMDGLNDLQEKTAGTDPNRDNTDCDGAWDTNDGFEIDHGMDPLNPDTDNDGIMDGLEIDMWIEKAGYDPSQPEEIPPEVIVDATTNTNDVDVDDDGVIDGEDICVNTAGKIEYQGCSVGDENLVELHIIDRLKTACDGAGSCKLPIEGALVRVFDRNDPDFQTQYTKNPPGTSYPDIFENDIGRVGSCTTDSLGKCVAGEETVGDYLVIVKYEEDGKTAYTGKPKSPEDFEDTDGDGIGDLAYKDFQIIKVIKKDGTIDFKAGSKTVVTGSMLEVIHPQYTIWESDQELYPFIFTSDSDWTVDVCVYVPEGYVVVEGNCTQVFVSGETKDIIFTVVETNSPPPNMGISIETKHKGKSKKMGLNIPGKWKEKKDKEPKGMPFMLAGVFGVATIGFMRKKKRYF